MVIWGDLHFFSCNFSPFYPIEMRFLLEIIEFYTENLCKIFTISFLNFCSDAKLDIIYDVTT